MLLNRTSRSGRAVNSGQFCDHEGQYEYHKKEDDSAKLR